MKTDVYASVYIKEMVKNEVKSENNKAVFLCVNQHADVLYVTMEVLGNNRIEMMISNTKYYIFYQKSKKKSFAKDICSVAVKHLKKHHIAVLANICSERGELAVI